MPLAPDASLFIPYTVVRFPAADLLSTRYVAVQKQGDDIIFMSSIPWPTQEEAERHAHDLNYLREQALKNTPVTNVWVSIDIAAEGPDGMVVLERVLREEGILGWRLLQPAADEDNDAWTKAREMVQNAVDALAAEELPEDVETLEEHLIDHHGFDLDSLSALGNQPDAWFVKHHRELHEDATALHLTHTHTPAEEVEDDGSAEEEGAHEDPDS